MKLISVIILILMIFPIPLLGKDVLAVEYPPFTTINKNNYGLSFELLAEAFPEQKFTPEFLPPKRALKRISNGDWCLSFYPATHISTFEIIKLSVNKVKIGLIKKRDIGDFTWERLEEMSGASVALLRSSYKSVFVKQFTNANLKVIYVESIKQGVELVKKGRVKFSMFDNYNYENLSKSDKEQLQFSDTYLIETPILLFVNPDCDMQLK